MTKKKKKVKRLKSRWTSSKVYQKKEKCCREISNYVRKYYEKKKEEGGKRGRGTRKFCTNYSERLINEGFLYSSPPPHPTPDFSFHFNAVFRQKIIKPSKIKEQEVFGVHIYNLFRGKSTRGRREKPFWTSDLNTFNYFLKNSGFKEKFKMMAQNKRIFGTNFV